MIKSSSFILKWIDYILTHPWYLEKNVGYYHFDKYLIIDDVITLEDFNNHFKDFLRIIGLRLDAIVSIVLHNRDWKLFFQLFFFVVQIDILKNIARLFFLDHQNKKLKKQILMSAV